MRRRTHTPLRSTTASVSRPGRFGVRAVSRQAGSGPLAARQGGRQTGPDGGVGLLAQRVALCRVVGEHVGVAAFEVAVHAQSRGLRPDPLQRGRLARGVLFGGVGTEHRGQPVVLQRVLRADLGRGAPGRAAGDAVRLEQRHAPACTGEQVRRGHTRDAATHHDHVRLGRQPSAARPWSRRALVPVGVVRIERGHAGE